MHFALQLGCVAVSLLGVSLAGSDPTQDTPVVFHHEPNCGLGGDGGNRKTIGPRVDEMKDKGKTFPMLIPPVPTSQTGGPQEGGSYPSIWVQDGYHVMWKYVRSAPDGDSTVYRLGPGAWWELNEGSQFYVNDPNIYGGKCYNTSLPNSDAYLDAKPRPFGMKPDYWTYAIVRCDNPEVKWKLPGGHFKKQKSGYYTIQGYKLPWQYLDNEY